MPAHAAMDDAPRPVTTPDVDWPSWPRVTPRALNSVARTLNGVRWAASGEAEDREPRDRVASRQLQQFLGARHVILVDHGSSALLAAMTALTVGPGDEVIVPGLTWVACATSVLRVGARPVLADIDPQTLCMDPVSVAALIGPRTKAIMAVHLYGSMADMDKLRELAARHGLAIVEDAAQAHGATWGGQQAGTLGTIGTFSFQQTKLLTCGEGGAVVVSDQSLASIIEQLRGDGRAFDLGGNLIEVGQIQGWNMHLAEFQCDLLITGLDSLRAENAQRARAASQLDRTLADVPGVRPIAAYPRNDARAFYRYAFELNPDEFQRADSSTIAKTLSRQVNLKVLPIHPALSQSRLYVPERFPLFKTEKSRLANSVTNFSLERAEAAARMTLSLPHQALLARPEVLDRIPEALSKIQTGIEHARRHRRGEDDK